MRRKEEKHKPDLRHTPRVSQEVLMLACIRIQSPSLSIDTSLYGHTLHNGTESFRMGFMESLYDGPSVDARPLYRHQNTVYRKSANREG